MKAESNAAAHGVAFEEATSIFGDPLASTVMDSEHSTYKDRFLTTGLSEQGRILIVWHTEREDGLRIIGAREATPQERRIYESGQ